MKRLTHTLALAASAAALMTAAACSAPSPSPEQLDPAPSTAAPAATPTPTEATPAEAEGNMSPVTPGTPTEGYYEYMGTDYALVGSFTIPGTCPADLLAALAGLGASDAACLTVDVDNRHGDDGVNTYAVNLYDSAGQRFTFQDASTTLDDLRDATGADLDVELINKYQEHVEMGERRDVHLVYTGTTPLPSTVDRVTVQPNGMFDTVDAYK